MMMRRRDFMAAAAGAGIGAASGGGSARAAETSKGKAVLKLSCQEGVMAGRDLKEKLDNLEELGFAALEPHGGGLPQRVDKYKQALEGRNVKISAICAGFQGCIIGVDPDDRAKAMRTMKEILTAAGQLGSTGMIIVPAFNRAKALPHKEARVLLTGFDRWDRRKTHDPKPLLVELGEFAAQAGTRVVLEPLNRDECYFMRTLADAASMCKDVSSPGMAMMGDFWHMTWEETCDMGAFLTGGDYLHHVHMASRRTRRIPTTDGDADNYVVGFKGLKAIGYQDYVSLECGGPKDQGERKKVLANCVKLLKEQWEKA
ncbi:MAG: sugar phosphate isomerase/epimerase [Phycisphaerae bacterium]|nr:sugar phosphate isomerase/epimerase [Phycisphaerae bacterium]